MTAAQLMHPPFCGVTVKKGERRRLKKWGETIALKGGMNVSSDHYFALSTKRRLSFINDTRCCGSISEQQITLDHGLNASSEEESLACTIGMALSKGITDSAGLPISTGQSRPQSVQSELIMLSIPAIAGQAIEPLAQLMETAYIGRLGPLELASAGVSMSIFNILSKVFNLPLLSVATSFVAEEISRTSVTTTSGGGHPSNQIAERKALHSVSTALLLAIVTGVFEALAMYLGSGLFLNMMGISSASPMRIPAERFLKLRAIGAPAVVVSLAIQGILRGFKDTKTPVFCLGVGNLSAVCLFPILIYHFGLGVTGAAISTVLSQYIVTFLMMWYLNKKTVLLLPNPKNLHFGGYLRSGGFLLGRTLAAVMTITLSTSMAAQQGAIAMAAHQICLQVWLSASLLADAQASSSQALVASSSTKGDFSSVKEISFFALKMGLFTGISLAILLGVSFSYLATLFTNDTEVLAIARSGLLFVSASQPLNAIAYIFDGLHYGISDFSYAAWSVMVVGAISSAVMVYAPSAIWSFWGLVRINSVHGHADIGWIYEVVVKGWTMVVLARKTFAKI